MLSLAYDLVATALVNPADDEDLALTLNGKKKKLKRKDFIAAFNTLKLHSKQQENILKKMNQAKDKWLGFVDISFLSDDYIESYKELIRSRFERLAMNN